jgi:hypothetical protein
VTDHIGIIDFKFAYFLEVVLKFEQEVGLKLFSSHEEFNDYWHLFKGVLGIKEPTS